MIEPVRVTGEWRVYPFGGRFGENPGSGSPEQRLREQDIDGVEAEILYPGSQGPNFWRGIKEDAVYKARWCAPITTGWAKSTALLRAIGCWGWALFPKPE